MRTDGSSSWDRNVGSQTPQEFMENSVGHEAPFTDDELIEAARAYCHEGWPWEEPCTDEEETEILATLQNEFQ